MILHTYRKPNKYHARKTTVCGRTFDSKREAEVYLELLTQKQAGEIVRIAFQPQYTLLSAFKDNEGKKQRAITYTADFFVTYADGRSEVIEVKGVRMRDYLLRKKAVSAHDERYGYCFSGSALMEDYGGRKL